MNRLADHRSYSGWNCRSCGGDGHDRGNFYLAAGFGTDASGTAPCPTCDGTGQLDHDQTVIDIARSHGTRAAADWSGWSPSRVRTLRRRVDGYDRGRGHPTRAELEAARPRLSCDCVRCIDWRSLQSREEARDLARLVAMADAKGDTDWMDHAACFGHDPDLFFPGRGESLREVRAICARCPVAQTCLDYSLARPAEKFGVWGGRSERERRRMKAGKAVAVPVGHDQESEVA